MKKYEITDIAHPDNPNLHRIRAVTDLTEDVLAGMLGGYVESCDNLDQDGRAWISEDAIACENAVVCGDAVLTDHAVARGNAYVGKNATVMGDATVQDDAIVCGGLLTGQSCVCGYAVIRQDEQTLCAPIIDGSTRIYGEISGNVVCRGNAVVLPGTKLDNRTQDCFVLEDDRVSVQTASRTPPPKEPRTHDFEREERRMPLTNTPETLNILDPDFRMPEHCGGDRWSILHGDSLQILRQFEPNSFDAIITDPPYASGGSSQTTKNRSTSEKYSSMSKEKALPDFDSDQMDQLSWMFWTAAWLQDARRIAKPGAPVCLFIDWRQLPAMTLALQWAGWTWRGVAVWDKVASRPQKGRFRQQSEYIVWGSNGKMPLERNVGCLPGVFRYPNPQNRIHVTEKPLQLMRDVVQICEPGGRILDPFSGAGTTVLAAVQEGYEAVGVEMSDAYFRRSAERLKTALESEVNQN